MLILLILLIPLSAWFCTFFGATRELTIPQINHILIEKIRGISTLETPAQTIVWDLRFNRILIAALVGASLALAGAAFQGLLRNPLADPYIVGTSAGAAVGGVLAIVFRVQASFLGISGITIMAFAGSIAAMYIIYRLSIIDGKIPVETFLLAGVVVGSFLWAMVSFLLTLADKSLHEVVFWLMGSTAMAGWQGVTMLSIYFFTGFAGLMYLSHSLNILTLGDESAQHLGVNVERTKILIIVFSSLITAAAVSVSGLIGFVGLMIPHMARMIVGADHRIMFPVCAAAGAIYLMWIDTAARSMLAPRELPVGILTAILGAPFFLYLLRNRKKTG